MIYIWLCLVLVCCLSVGASEQCIVSTFYRRYEFDNFKFSDATLLYDDLVEHKFDCVRKCYMRSLCNQANYQGITKRCRLHSDTAGSETSGTYDAGWHYYGPSCDNYRLNRAVPSSNVLSSNAEYVCENGSHALTTCTPTSCYSAGKWIDFALKCTPTLFAYPQSPIDMVDDLSLTLDFDFKQDQVISLQLSGSPDITNEVEITNNNGDVPYLLAIQWYPSYTLCTFTTRRISGSSSSKGGTCDFDQHSSYTIDIHIMESKFKTYGNGNLLLNNKMEIPFKDITKISTRGISAIQKFKVGLDICLN